MLFEKLSTSPNELFDWFDRVTGNPAIRAAGMGTAGYYGSKWAYNKLADKMVGGYMDQIKDPEIRKREYDAYLERRNKIQPWISGTFAAIGAGLPLMHPAALSRYAATRPGAGFGDVVKPFFQNFPEAMKDIDKLGEEKALRKVAEYYLSSDAPYSAEFSAHPEVATMLPGIRAPYTSSGDDLLLGKSFVMPGVRPLTFWNVPDIPKHQSIELLGTQIPIIGADNAQLIAQGMHSAEDDSNSGMVSTGDIFKGLIRTGVGAGVGYTLANVLGTIMAQPAEVKSKMAHYGAIGGAVVNSGILGYGWDRMKDMLNSKILGIGQDRLNSALTDIV